MAAPFLVGDLNDLPSTPEGKGIDPWLRQAVDELKAAGRLDRDVQFIRRDVDGLPSGTAAATGQGRFFRRPRLRSRPAGGGGAGAGARVHPGGVREGLERIKWLPAAEGFEGSLLGFGVHDRGALHGRYLVLRQWRDGQSVQV